MKNNLLTAPTLWQLLVERVAINPQQIFLVEGDYKHLKVTVGQCLQLAEKMAAGLYERGVGPGTVVAWQMPTRLHTVILSLALSRLGVVQNPILHLYRGRELSDLLSQSKPQWILVPEAEPGCDYPALAAAAAKPLGCQVMVLGEQYPQGDISRLPASPSDAHQARWIFCTSGTTSKPKAALHSDASLIAGGHGLAVALQTTNKDVGSIAYPYAHIGGVMYLVMLLEVGMSAVLLERFKVEHAAEVFRRYKVTVTGGSTAHYQAWLELQRQQPDTPVLPDLRLLSGGGASKPAQYYYQIKAEIGVPVVHSYGMTESPLVCSNLASSTEQHLAYTDGKPAEGMEVRVQKTSGGWAKPGEIGEILIRGNCLCQGYLDPEQTAVAFDNDGFYHTGDLGSFDEEGYLSLSGRLKDIIIRKGENISAREIEELLLEHENISDVAIIGLPDVSRGEKVCAVVELSQGSLTLKEVTDFLSKAELMKQKWPEQLEIVDQLPRSEALGKVAKQQLRAMFSE